MYFDNGEKMLEDARKLVIDPTLPHKEHNRNLSKALELLSHAYAPFANQPARIAEVLTLSADVWMMLGNWEMAARLYHEAILKLTSDTTPATEDTLELIEHLLWSRFVALVKGRDRSVRLRMAAEEALNGFIFGSLLDVYVQDKTRRRYLSIVRRYRLLGRLYVRRLVA